MPVLACAALKGLRWKDFLMKQRCVFYPLLIALYPTVAFYAQNALDLPLSELAWPLGLMAAASVLVGAILWLVVKDAARAGMLTVVAFAVFSTVQLAPEWVDNCLRELSSFWVICDIHVWRPLAIAGELAATSVLVWAILTKVKDPKAWTVYLNAFALVLIVLPSTRVILTIVREPAKASGPPGAVGRPPGAVTEPLIAAKKPPGMWTPRRVSGTNPTFTTSSSTVTLGRT